MKNLLTLLAFSLFFVARSQSLIGPPSLSVGTDEVLFQKGVLDVELIGEIISEKQDEIKKELAKRIMLNDMLTDGPYLTYDYAETVLNTLMEHKDKNVIKKSLLEHSTELAAVIGMAESYLRIKEGEIKKLELSYLKYLGKETEIAMYYDSLSFNDDREFYLKDDKTNFRLEDKLRLAPSQTFSLQLKNGKLSPEKAGDKVNYSFDTSSKTRKGGFLPKISRLYELKKLGNKGGFYLHYILMDMFLELSRKNEVLQRLGFFQKEFDEVAFNATSKYRRFIELKDDSKAYKNLVKKLNELYQKADGIISTNLVYSDLILDLPKKPTKQISLAEINKLYEYLYSVTSTLEIKDVKLTKKEQEVLQQLSQLAYYAYNTTFSNEPEKQYDEILYELKNLIPDLLTVSMKFKELKTILPILRNTLEGIQNHQYYQLLEDLKTALGYEPSVIRTDLAELFTVFVNLDKAKSYDQIAKLIVDIGQIFPKIQDNRIMNDLANLQQYLIIDTDSNRVDVQVEDLILFLYDKYVKHTSQRVALHFTVGFNYLYSLGGNDVGQISYASEKIGLRFKVWDNYKHKVYKSRYFKKKQDPIINHYFLLAYGSGLLYQIEALKSEDSFNEASYGIAAGINFFNGLDFTLGITSISLNGTREGVLNAGFDIPLGEYIARLAKKNKKKDN